MIDSKYLLFVQHLEDCAIESHGGRKVLAERLFDHDALPFRVFLFRETGRAQLLYDNRKKCGARGQVKQAIPFRSLFFFYLRKLFSEPSEKFHVFEVAG